MSSIPGPPPATPCVYMTPLLAKRRDGLCPSLLDINDPMRAVKPQGGLNKAYRTNSRLLLQLRGQGEVNSDGAELQSIMDSIDDALQEHVGPTEDIVSCDFKAKGCCWTLEFSSSLNDADKNYNMQVLLLANEINGVLNYVADVMLAPKVPVDPNPLAPPLKGFREAKEVFDVVALSVRKAVVRLEFPEFPEGCKGRPFREVYQLNARVSITLQQLSKLSHQFLNVAF